jgi:hypothetical protein
MGASMAFLQATALIALSSTKDTVVLDFLEKTP